jgi:beta-hydroxylase
VSAFLDPETFPFVARLAAAHAAIVAELRRLGGEPFPESPDSLTTVADGYDETGWRWFGLIEPVADLQANRARCPDTVRACGEVPGLVNAGFSQLLPGTHLYPHRGEMAGVLRCHLALVVPDGDCAIRFGHETRRWQVGRCLVFDDTLEHEAWNRGDGERVVLLVTFERAAASVRSRSAASPPD